MSLPALSLEGRCALVTGAAGRHGIGRAIALAFAEAGADVAVCDNEADLEDRDLAAVAEEIAAFGRRSLAVTADVGRKADIERLTARVAEALGPVDILVNNAAVLGRSWGQSSLDATEEEWDRVMAVNLKGGFLLAQAVGRDMMARKTGNIINIDSMEAVNTMIAKGSPYSVSKAGLQFLTRVLARQLGPHGVRVNSIAPGGVATDMGRHHQHDLGLTPPPAPPRPSDPPPMRNLPGVTDVPLGRMARSEEVAYVALFLASSLASYVTGAIIVADGGWTA